MSIFGYGTPSSFSLGLDNPSNSFSFDLDYDAIMPYNSSERGGGVSGGAQNPLEDILGGFDEYGRYGIGEEQKKKAQYAQLAQVFAGLGQAGFYTGDADKFGQIASQIPGKSMDAYNDSLDTQSQRKLASELAKLDITGKYTAAEKDKLALKLAQEQYDERTEMRRAGYEAYRSAMPPGAEDAIVGSFSSPEEQRQAKMELGLADVYMRAGEHEKAKALFDSVVNRTDPMFKKNLERQAELHRAKSKAEAGGKYDAQSKYNADMLKQFGGDASGLGRESGGDLYPLLPHEQEIRDLTIEGKRLDNKATKALVGSRERSNTDSGLDKAGIRQRLDDERAWVAQYNEALAAGYAWGEDSQGVPVITKNGKPIHVYGVGSDRAKQQASALEDAMNKLKTIKGYNPDGKTQIEFLGLSAAEGAPTLGAADAITQNRYFAKIADRFLTDPVLRNGDPAILAKQAAKQVPGITEEELAAILTYLQTTNKR